MRSFRRGILAALSLVAVSGVGFSPETKAAARPVFTAQRIPLPARSTVIPIALNDEGQALMSATTCRGCARRYYLWNGASSIRIVPPAGASTFEPVGIGPSETFAGISQYGSGPQPVIRSFQGRMASEAAVFHPLLDPAGNADGVEAAAVGTNGDILGRSTIDPDRYYLWPAGQYRARSLNLPAPDGGTADVTALDGAGDLAGIVQTATGSEAVVWPVGGAPAVLNGSFVADGSAGGEPAIGGIRASAGGTVYVSSYQTPVGYARTRCGLWVIQPGSGGAPPTISGPRYLHTLSGSHPSVLCGPVVPPATIVGESWAPSSGTALLYRNGGEWPLRDLVQGPRPPAKTFRSLPAGVDGSGRILVGDWLLTPTT